MPKTTNSKTPKGFLFSTAEAAIKKPGRKDLALILSENGANIAGAFTTNTVKAAPVRICMQKIKSGKGRLDSSQQRKRKRLHRRSGDKRRE